MCREVEGERPLLYPEWDKQLPWNWRRRWISWYDFTKTHAQIHTQGERDDNRCGHEEVSMASERPSTTRSQNGSRVTSVAGWWRQKLPIHSLLVTPRLCGYRRWQRERGERGREEESEREEKIYASTQAGEAGGVISLFRVVCGCVCWQSWLFGQRWSCFRSRCCCCYYWANGSSHHSSYN